MASNKVSTIKKRHLKAAVHLVSKTVLMSIIVIIKISNLVNQNMTKSNFLIQADSSPILILTPIQEALTIRNPTTQKRE